MEYTVTVMIVASTLIIPFVTEAKNNNHISYIMDRTLDGRYFGFTRFRGKLFGGAVMPNSTLFSRTVPQNSILLGGTPD